MITVEMAKRLPVGTELHHNRATNADGTCQRWRTIGKPRTWKRSPDRVELSVKHGFYDYDRLDEFDLKDFHTVNSCPQEVAA